MVDWNSKRWRDYQFGFALKCSFDAIHAVLVVFRGFRVTKFNRSVSPLRARPTKQVAWLLLGLSACGPATMAERSGESMRQGLPAVLATLLPADVKLCHEESVGDGPDYHLWVFRHDSGHL